jgi:hypothetical protein
MEAVNGHANDQDTEASLEEYEIEKVYNKDDDEGWEEDERRRIGRRYLEVLLDSGMVPIRNYALLIHILYR